MYGNDQSFFGDTTTNENGESNKSEQEIDPINEINNLKEQLAQQQEKIKGYEVHQQKMNNFFGGNDQQIDPLAQNEQLKQMLSNDPASIFNSYGETIKQDVVAQAKQAASEQYAIAQATNHFQAAYPHLKEHAPYIGLEVNQLTEEISQSGKAHEYTPQQVVDMAAQRFTSKFNGNGNQQQVNGNQYQNNAGMNQLGVGNMGWNPPQAQSQPRISWASTDEELRKFASESQQRNLGNSFHL